ncbi:hypothetical protein M9458_053500, partial [Cirrhinus mrigala]
VVVVEQWVQISCRPVCSCLGLLLSSLPGSRSGLRCTLHLHIQELRQGHRSIADYATEFCTLAVESIRVDARLQCRDERVLHTLVPKTPEFLAAGVKAVSPSCDAEPMQGEPVDLSGMPTEYSDLKEVFSKSRAAFHPPHRPYDCAIDLLL